MYSKLYEFAQKFNVIVGVGTAEPFCCKDKSSLEDIPFVTYSIEERLNPKITMLEAQSLVAVGLPYNTLYNKNEDSVLRGRISSGAIGIDYHVKITNILKEMLSEWQGKYKIMIFADTGPLIDRYVAIRCGLGYIGKHHGVINKDIGSMFFIGYAITDIPFECWNFNADQDTGSCGECNRCIKACPTGALACDPFDYKKCISYITQKSGILTDEECEAIGTNIYGCDICQKACNKNSFNYSSDEYAYPNIEELLNISNKEFKTIYGKTAAGWRGKKILQRNAIIALGNLKNTKALELLYKLADDSRAEISHSAKWAINNIMKG